MEESDKKTKKVDDEQNRIKKKYYKENKKLSKYYKVITKTILKLNPEFY